MKERSYDYSVKSSKPTNKLPPSNKKVKPSSRAGQREDEDLLASMSKRLQKLEKTCESQRL